MFFFSVIGAIQMLYDDDEDTQLLALLLCFIMIFISLHFALFVIFTSLCFWFLAAFVIFRVFYLYILCCAAIWHNKVSYVS